MKFLMMAHCYVPGHNAGAETHTHAMLRALATAGHDVDVQLSNVLLDGPYEVDGVRVWGKVDKGDPFRFDPHVYLCHLENTPRATVIAEGQRRGLVHVCHNDMLQTAKWLGRRSVSLGVWNSNWMGESLRAQSGYTGLSVTVHPYPEPDTYRTKPGDKVTLVNLWPDKGGLTFAELARRMPDVQFLGVIGAYGHQHIPDLPNVQIVRHTANMRDDVYAHTRILLMPSSYESWGRVASEAMVSGIPVIAAPTPGLQENLGDAAGGWARPQDLNDWEDAIRRLLKPRAWSAASRAAKARAERQAEARSGEIDLFVTAMEHLAARYRHLAA